MEITLSAAAPSAPPSQQPAVPTDVILVLAGVIAFGMAVSLLAAFLLQKWQRLRSIWSRSVCAALVWPLSLLAVLLFMGVTLDRPGLGRVLNGLPDMPWEFYAFFALVVTFDWLAAILLLGSMQWRARRKRRAGFDVFG